MSEFDPREAPPPGGAAPTPAGQDGPIEQQAPRRIVLARQDRIPWVSYSILAITILVYLAQVGSEFISGYDIPATLGMKVNFLIERGELWRLFTPMLLHGGILHIGFNMYALFVIGPDLERQFGRTRFFLLYILSGFAGNVFSMAFTQANSLGASTAIFGLLGAQGVFVYQNRELFGSRGRIVLNRILYLAFINLVIGLQEGIDNWGHVGGLIGGVAYTWFAGPLLALRGMRPAVEVYDRRDQSAALTAALAVGLVFAGIALFLILSP